MSDERAKTAAPNENEPDRRTFLKLVGAAAMATPAFLTLGAHASGQSPYERAQRYLGKAKNFVSRARKAEGAQRQQLATEAMTELTEARLAAADATAAEQERLSGPIARVARAIEDLDG